MTSHLANRAAYDGVAEQFAARAEDQKISVAASLDGFFLPRLFERPGWNDITHDYFPLTPRVLDVGCGNGVATEHMAKHGCDATGIDFSERMIEVCRRDRDAGGFYQADYMEVTWCGLDGILAFAFVHLFPKAQAPAIIAKMHSELRPGGYLYTGTTVEEESREGWEHKSDYSGGHHRFRARYRADEAMSLYLSSGLTLEDVSIHNDAFGKKWLDVLLRRPEH